MGSFGYICKGCGTSLQGHALHGGENCVLIHVRHGVELGRTDGHYNEYGTTIEEDTKAYNGELDTYRAMGCNCSESYENSHEQICASEYGLDDSYYKLKDANALESTSDKENATVYSGTVAWHKACYAKASAEEQADLTPSKPDPNQSWGKIRKKYM